MTAKEIGKKALLGVIFCWGMLSFMVLAGDEDPNVPMTAGEFFWAKFAAAASLALCVLVGRYCFHKGWLPEDLNNIEDDEI